MGAYGLGHPCPLSPPLDTPPPHTPQPLCPPHSYTFTAHPYKGATPACGVHLPDCSRIPIYRAPPQPAGTHTYAILALPLILLPSDHRTYAVDHCCLHIPGGCGSTHWTFYPAPFPALPFPIPPGIHLLALADVCQFQAPTLRPPHPAFCRVLCSAFCTQLILD